jgi:two-component system, response regulator PdtaR
MIMRHRMGIAERRLAAERENAPLRRTSRRAAIHPQGALALTGSMGASGSDGPSSSSPPHADLLRRRIAASGRALRVIVVEDDALIAMELERTLLDLGTEVLGIAATAAEALRLAERHHPDCALMDISIKGDRDGVSSAVEMYETLGIRSIFVSAFGNEETRARAAPAHPFCWVKKPFNVDDLRSALNRVSDED